MATGWAYVSEDAAEAERVLTGVLAPSINRSLEELRERVSVGTPEHRAELLGKYARAGVQRFFLWPLQDEVEQLERFLEQVLPRIEAAG